MLTDTHCHVLSSEYENTHTILNNLKNDGVKRIIINGYNQNTNKEVVNLVKKYDNVYGTLGIHPNEISNFNESSINYINENINNKKIIGVGEIGLDYYRNKDNKQEQIELFETMLSLATKHNKPVIIHNRNSTDDIIKILKQYNLKGIMHSFSGSYETATELLKIGFKLGINGIVTFKNSNLKTVLKNIPIKNILIETDSPYLTPEPFRGEKNEPKNILFVAKELCNIYDVSIEEISVLLEENLLEVFDIFNK